MAGITVIPYSIYSEQAVIPNRSFKYRDKYVYNLASPIDGILLHSNTKIVPLFFEIIVPFGVNCSVKSIYYETNDLICHDEDLNSERGLTHLKDGQNYGLTLLVPLKANWKKLIKRGDVLGFIVFNKEVIFQRYDTPVSERLLLKYRRTSTLAYLPSQSLDSVAIDLPSLKHYEVEPSKTIKIETGLVFQFPEFHSGTLFIRAAIAHRYSIGILGGFVEPETRKPINIVIKNHGNEIFIIERGDCVAQMLVVPHANVILTECVLDPPNNLKRGTNLKKVNLIQQRAEEMPPISEVNEKTSEVTITPSPSQIIEVPSTSSSILSDVIAQTITNDTLSFDEIDFDEILNRANESEEQFDMSVFFD